MKRHDESCIR